MPDWLGHMITSGIGFVAAIIGLYVSYKILQLKDWFRSEMLRIVKDNCAGKAEFDAHVKADDVFQKNLASNLTDHEASADELLTAKFKTVETQIGSVVMRVDSLTRLVEQKLR